jgi:hypothetical protein
MLGSVASALAPSMLALLVTLPFGDGAVASSPD